MREYRNPALMLDIEESLQRREREVWRSLRADSCSMVDCERPVHAKWLCKAHYDHQRRKALRGHTIAS